MNDGDSKTKEGNKGTDQPSTEHTKIANGTRNDFPPEIAYREEDPQKECDFRSEVPEANRNHWRSWKFAPSNRYVSLFKSVPVLAAIPGL